MDRDHAPVASSSKSCYDLTPPDTSAPPPHELFRSPGAELFLVDTGDERLPIRSGDFALLLVKSFASPLAAVMAMVGEVQWPVGSDCIVRKEGDASFVFSLPGALEYLVFLGAETVSATDLRRVEDLLEEYAAYAAPRLQFQPAGDGTSGLDAEDFSPLIAETQQASKLTQWLPRSGGSGVSSEAEGPVMGIGGALSRKRSGDADTRGRVQRARRLSAVAKLFSKILERGAINISIHVEPMMMEVSADQQLTAASSLAMAGADAVIRVVDAVETGGRILLESVGSVVMEKYKQSSATGSCMVDKPTLLHSGWTLNKLGLLMLFRMIGASMAAHSSSSRLSGSSSSSGICRLLSSSSSSSSFSSKSPTKASQPLPGDLPAETPSLQPRSTVTTISLPPSPPLFTSATPLVRHPSTMPPPSGPPPAPAASTSQDSSSSFRIYKPRASPATATSSTPSPPPPLPRPPRFQPPARR